ncbi:uncharacterized protein EAF02_008571 [Botrytis sinoallii]|uniref:uncharacterized protein n=1 Tax=Botrytis sinoallii TaxID=1463999 RepID=UPI0018FF2B9C|nr:uncharacterized protein EAF02_008571 [Botrytis sinoallii]KAF7874594.1 hypothetical protein EAF02_008571 [Botrytis sinoallii]
MLCKVCDRLNVTDLLEQAKANSGKPSYSDDYRTFEHHKRYDDLPRPDVSFVYFFNGNARKKESRHLGKVFLDQLHWNKKFRVMEATENRHMDLRVEIETSDLYCDQPFEKEKVFNHLTFRHYNESWKWNFDYYTKMVCILQTPKDQPKFIDDIRIGQFIVDEDLASDANFDIARGWMNTCIVEHSESKCPSFEDKVLPSRVIDVGLEDTNPSLFVTNGLGGKWIALSHCWGGRIETVLTTSNLQSLQKEIKMTNLPANFRDAILITRGLSFQYLWIDSLCIIQDSIHDWSTESTKMGDIYRNSVLTIGAAAVHKAADGILHTRSQISHEMKPKLKLSKDSGFDDVVEIATSILEPENLARLFKSGPLQSRAWALQERILSPRILWYGRRQIYWQCPCGFQSANGMPSDGSSDFPLSKNYIYPVFTRRLVLNQNYNDEFTRFSEEELLEINREYQFMVEDYCNRNLTYPNDKLPAFSGIAALLHKGVGGHYLAGIWSKFFQKNLLWYGISSWSDTVPHIKQYRAPSWSWAAVGEGTSIFYYDSIRFTSTSYGPILLSHHIELASENPYGAVRYAHIIVDTLTLKLIHLGEYMNPSNKTGFSLTLHWFGDTELSLLSPQTLPESPPGIPLEKQGEIETPSEGSAASTTAETSLEHAKLRTAHIVRWDEGYPDWLAVSPLKCKIMFVVEEKRPEKYEYAPMVEFESCLKCLILQEDPEDTKVCRRIGQMELKFFYEKTEKPDLDAWLASDRWERETLKLI